MRDGLQPNPGHSPDGGGLTQVGQPWVDHEVPQGRRSLIKLKKLIILSHDNINKAQVALSVLHGMNMYKIGMYEFIKKHTVKSLQAKTYA